MPKGKKGKSQIDKGDIDDQDDDVLAAEPIDESFMKGLVPKAIEYAKRAHDGQLRDDGSSYFGHVERVANQVIKQCDTHAYITALLHDVLEDSKTTVKDLETAFNEDIAKDVLTLTKVDGVDFETYMKRIVIKYVPFYVKLVDRLDNMRSLPLCGNADKILRYTKETRDQFIPIAKAARYAKLPEFANLIAEIEKHF